MGTSHSILAAVFASNRKQQGARMPRLRLRRNLRRELPVNLLNK